MNPMLAHTLAMVLAEADPSEVELSFFHTVAGLATIIVLAAITAAYRYLCLWNPRNHVH